MSYQDPWPRGQDVPNQEEEKQEWINIQKSLRNVIQKFGPTHRKGADAIRELKQVKARMAQWEEQQAEAQLRALVDLDEETKQRYLDYQQALHNDIQTYGPTHLKGQEAIEKMENFRVYMAEKATIAQHAGLATDSTAVNAIQALVVAAEVSLAPEILNPARTTMLEAVHLPGRPTDSLWDVTIADDTISSITLSNAFSDVFAAEQPHSLLLPSLCHPHIHLDKPYLLCSSHSRYTDLVPTSGTFSEALANTSKAKARYDKDDLLLRGSQLIVESVKCGVTSMRAFVEVDCITKFHALEAGIELKRQFKGVCEVQLVAFAQDPIMSGPHGEENRKLLLEALGMYGGDVDVLGTTPYVEEESQQLANIKWAIATALKYKLHLDLHLDYNLTNKAYIWDVLSLLRTASWSKDKTIVVGHATRLSLFTTSEMQRLADEIHSSQLPISFIGLPTSDMFMQGRPSDKEWAGQRPRGTLQILELIHRFGLDAAIGVNNVGNPFTPWGNCDPLRLASLGVGIYQAGTEKDAETLLGCVGWRARKAIGLGQKDVGKVEEGVKGSWMLIKNRGEDVAVVGKKEIKVKARQWKSVRDVVWDPPESGMRNIVD